MNWLLGISILIVAGLFLSFYFQKTGGRERKAGDAPDDKGSLRKRPLRKDGLSKEVELAWEASETIEFQPGAYAWPGDASERGEPDPHRERSPGGSPRRGNFRDEEYALPERYGRDRLILMARDPQWVYAYWEITHDRYRNAMEKHLAEWGLSRPALRLYDVTPGSHNGSYLDVLVSENAGDWYVHVDRPRHTLVAEYGRLYPGGFIPLLRSNPVTLPPWSPDMEVALEWSESDWMRLFGRRLTGYYASSPLVWRQ